MGSAKKARRKRLLRKLRRIVLSIVGVVFVGWIFYLGVTWGPRSPDAKSRVTVDSASRQLVDESRELSRRFEDIATFRDPTAAELSLLEEAIEKQRIYNRDSQPLPEDFTRLRELEARLAHFLAKDLHGRSLAAEQESEHLLKEGGSVEAVAKLREAFELQRQINQRFGRSSFRDTFRETRLEQAVAASEAAPLHGRSVKLETEADAAMADFRWAEARVLLNEAVDLQTRVNQTSRRSAFYDQARIAALGRKVDSLRVGEMISEVQVFEEQGIKFESDQQWEKAAQEYERAMVLQNQINRDHPQSPFVSTERMRELDEARQTALSAPEGRQLQRELEELRTMVRQGEFATVSQKVETAGAIAARLLQRFPRSRYVDAQVSRELQYLGASVSQLSELQRLLGAALLPVPEHPGWQMSAGPVSQRVYARVMNSNPSRNVGEDLPVDSITLRQAEEFCLRASWILARPVTLPSKAKFEAVLGDWESTVASASSWHEGNSGGVSHPVASGSGNNHGFLHLVGNLRIWLQDSTANGSAWTAGASFADPLPGPDELFKQISSTQRAATVGLRYVVGE